MDHSNCIEEDIFMASFESYDAAQRTANDYKTRILNYFNASSRVPQSVTLASHPGRGWAKRHILNDPHIELEKNDVTNAHQMPVLAGPFVNGARTAYVLGRGDVKIFAVFDNNKEFRGVH